MPRGETLIFSNARQYRRCCVVAFCARIAVKSTHIILEDSQNICHRTKANRDMARYLIDKTPDAGEPASGVG